MARDIFKSLPDRTTPLNPTKLNGVFNGEEAMGSIVVDDISSSNLFDGLMELGSMEVTDASETTNANFVRCVNFIKVKPNSNYIFNINGNTFTTTIRYFFYDENYNYLSNKTGDSFITTPENCYYIRFHSSAFKTEYGTNLPNPQIKEGDVNTSYTPYKKFGYNSQESMGKIIVDDISIKNKFNDNYYEVKATANADFSKLSNGYRITANVDTSSSVYVSLRAMSLVGLEGKTVTLSFNTVKKGLDAGYIELFTGSLSGRKDTLDWVVGKSHTFTVPIELTSTNTYLWITLIGSKDVSVLEGSYVDFVDFQIEVGENATPYTPHKDFSFKTYDATHEFIINSSNAELSTTYTSKIFKKGNIVWLNLYLTLKNPVTAVLASTNVGSVSGSIIPSIAIVDKCMISTADQNGWNFNVADGQVNISSDGAITVRNSLTTTSAKKYIGINLIYFV